MNEYVLALLSACWLLHKQRNPCDKIFIFQFEESMTTKINSNLLLEVLEATPASQNIMLMGKHGIGKSQILEKYFTARGGAGRNAFSWSDGRPWRPYRASAQKRGDWEN